MTSPYTADSRSMMPRLCPSCSITVIAGLLLTMHCLDVTHCNHLRDMIGIKWPRGHISNNKLYERCSTPSLSERVYAASALRSLSERVYAARWKMLGHILCYDEDTPALLALKFCIFTEESGSGFIGRRGTPRMNLLNVFRNDLKRCKIVNTLENLDDFENLRGPLL